MGQEKLGEQDRLGWARARLDRLNNRLHDALSRSFPLRPFPLPEDRRIISFTFDDVPDSAESTGAKILERYGFHGTFYIAGGLVGSVETHRQLITEDGLRRLAEAGHDIGCHTYAHWNVPSVGARDLAVDLDRNHAYLHGIEPNRVGRRNFAYPYCASSMRSRGLFADRFATCRSGGERINRDAVDLAFLEAVEIRQPEQHSQQLTRWIDDLVANPGWLIFYTHDISDRPTPFGCTPETFEKLVSHAAQSGAEVLSIRDALAHIGAEEGAP